MQSESALNVALAVALVGVPVAAWLLGEPYIVTLATRTAILALAAVGLNIALGLGGLVSFGHAAYFGLGGYVAGILASHEMSGEFLLTWPIAIGGTNAMLAIWPIAILAGGLSALAIGALSLRTSGVYFIMITLAFAQMLFYFAISWPAYGGEDGLPFYVRNAFPGLNTMNSLQFFLVSYALLAFGLLVFHCLERSPFGLALRASRHNPSRVASVGIQVYRLRLTAFVLSGAVTGLAGALYADLNRFASPQMFGWHTSGEFIVFIILGGVGRLFGPVAGAILFVLLEQVLGNLTEYWQLPLGLLLLCVVLYARGGLIGIITRGRSG